LVLDLLGNIANGFLMNKIFLVYLIAFAPLYIFGQSEKSNDCNKVKYGTFYFYPANAQTGFVVIRRNSLQEEINLKTRDTSFWKIQWTSSCGFNLKFIRKSLAISVEEKVFYNSHLSVVEISKITKDYYVFKGGLDSLSGKGSMTDTLWFKAKMSQSLGL
jgi:hypothetical protein